MSRSDRAGGGAQTNPPSAETEADESGDTSRRDFMKATSAATAAGALGALAGCMGDRGKNKAGGGSESVTVTYLSAQAAENADINSHYKQSMKTFEEKQGDVKVDLQTASYGDVKSKLSSTVSSGNPPTFAEGGSGALQYYFNGKVPDHGPFYEKSDILPDDFIAANDGSAQFRGEYWAAGAVRATTSNLGIRPKLFSQVGVSDPFKDLETWSGFLEYAKKIDQQTDTIAFEQTGVYNDLESYWGEARTAYTEGTDPWLRGDPKNPDVVVGNQDHEDRGKTDGMIVNSIKLAKEFSTEESASRGDEEIPSLMLTDKVASFTYATPTANRWFAVKEDAKIGWHGGDGDYMLLPNPKVDPDYGKNFGIPDLEGVEGEHGGHVWTLEQQQQIFDVDQKKQDAAWKLNEFVLNDDEFTLPAWGKYYEAIPGLKPQMQKVLNKYGDDLAQSTTQAFDNVKTYGPQYATTGASWDVKTTDQIRWTDINETISQAIAGQVKMDDAPGVINQKVKKSLKKND